MTNRLGFDLSTVVADSLQDFLDLGQETYALLVSTRVMMNYYRGVL